MLRTNTLLVTTLVGAMSLFACDSAEEDVSVFPLELDLVGGAWNDDSGVTADLNRCFYRTPDEGDSYGKNYRLDSGRLRLLPEGTFELDMVGQRYPYDVTRPESLSVAGGFEQHGSLLRLSPLGRPVWFATIGPTATAPTTVILADQTPGYYRLLDSCWILVFSSDEEPSWRTSGDVASEAFRLRQIGTGSGGFTLPSGYFGRRAENRYDSARVDIRPDGSYRFILWHLNGDPYYDISSYDETTTDGSYLKNGPLYLFDPGSARMSFGERQGDSLVVHRNRMLPFTLYGWDSDLIFRME